jgi:hypothetical protein
MTLLLLHGASWDPSSVTSALAAGPTPVERRVINGSEPLRLDERPTVVVLDEPLRRMLGAAGVRSLAEAGAAIVALGKNGEADVPGDMPGGDVISAFVPQGGGQRQLLVALRAAFREAASRIESARARAESAQRSKEIAELTRIGVALSTERNYDVLLEMILSQARAITQSDGGSLYLVEGRDTPTPRLRFKLTQSDTMQS